jgi:uroporphyrinogen decarboxylase
MRNFEVCCICSSVAFVPANPELDPSQSTPMRHQDRVLAALHHKPVDRVPIWMWFHPSLAVQLASSLEIPPDRLADALGDDIRQTWVGNNHAMEGIVHEREGDSHTDFWGIEWVKEGFFNQIRRSPLAQADELQLRQYAFPYARTGDLLSNMDAVVANRRDYFVGCDISPCLLELLFRVRGMEDALFDLAAAPETANMLLGKAADFAVHLAHEACSRFTLDWLWTGDDVGGQESMMLSPNRWRESLRPHLARIFAVGKEHNLPVAYHSCGAIRPIIPDLIDIGLDVLNPIQCNCPGMDPVGLKRDFGRDLAFMGGVDTQDLLPRGSADEVFRQTRRLIEEMTVDGGGYILAASHSVPPETPLKNVFAMYAAAGETREAIMDRAAAIRAGE